MLKEQPFLGGQKPTYADYALVSIFLTAKCTSSFPVCTALLCLVHNQRLWQCQRALQWQSLQPPQSSGQCARLSMLILSLCVLQIIEKDDIVYAWRDRVLDLFDGAARKNKMFDS